MFGFGKKEKEDAVLNGGKNVAKKDVSKKKDTSKANSKKADTVNELKKENKPAAKRQKGGNKNAIVRENFPDISAIPENARIVSTIENGDYFVPKELQEDILILDAFHAPQGVGEEKTCIIFICTEKERTKVDIRKFRLNAKKQEKVFIYSERENAKPFIEGLSKQLKKNDTQEDQKFSKKQTLAMELFQSAVDAGASDLHIEVRKNKTTIRARINGSINPFNESDLGAVLPEEDGMDLCRSIFNSLSGVGGKPFNERNTQDALVVVKSPRDGSTFRIRVATAPSEPEGFDMVMRLLVVKNSSEALTLEQLGYQPKQRTMIEEAVAQGVGVTIIAGTTGSGKSTTLQNVLKGEINAKSGQIKVITVEDPPEYFIPGATQIPVVRDEKGDAKTAFKNAIKASMRMDPDVIMIGEVRDEQSAELLIEAVQTGHKVLSTIHAASALSIIPRLENLGIDREVLGDTEFISGLIYQKLFPVLCKHCSIPLKDGFIPSKKPIEKILIENAMASEESIHKAKTLHPNVTLIRALQDIGVIDLGQAEKALSIFKKENNEEDNEKFLKRIASVAGNINEHDIRFRGEGCEHCKKGIAGRTVVSEVVRPDMRLRELIAEGKNTEVFKYWRKNLGGKPANEDAYDKMLKGLLSPIDVEDTFGYITIKNDL